MGDNHKAEDFFLRGGEPHTHLYFGPLPIRANCMFKPLIDGATTFKAMETAIAAAKKSVEFSSWVFDPTTPLQRGPARKSGLINWSDLLVSAAKRGVVIRVLLTDFDPVFQPDLHKANWKAQRQMRDAAARGGAARDNLQIVVSRHPQIVQGFPISLVLNSKFNALVKSLNGKKGVSRTQLRRLPGLWRWLRYDAKKKTVARDEDAELFASPASHHQKFLIVDRSAAYCGGLDVAKGRIETPNHSSLVASWHDVHCSIEGDAVADIFRNFVDRWRDEVAIYEKFVKEANLRGMPDRVPDQKLTHPKDETPPAATKGTSPVQILRTVSRRSEGNVPTPAVRDIEKSYQRAIGQANQFIYVENQYIRSAALANWIKERAKTVKNLQVIFALPVAPEEVSSKGGADDITKHGLYLQHELLVDLKKMLGSRFGMYSMVKRKRATKKVATNAFNSFQIYLHSKLLIVDDVYASIGSANANPRAFLVDTELAAGVFDPPRVRALRLRLWRELCGTSPESWKPYEFVRKWDEIATKNERLSPHQRSGFIIRHNPENFPGEKSLIIPDAFADVFDLETGSHMEEEIA